MFSALVLAKNGYRPLIFERGSDVDTRHQDIEKFWQGGQLKENSMYSLAKVEQELF